MHYLVTKIFVFLFSFVLGILSKTWVFRLLHPSLLIHHLATSLNIILLSYVQLVFRFFSLTGTSKYKLHSHCNREYLPTLMNYDWTLNYTLVILFRSIIVLVLTLCSKIGYNGLLSHHQKLITLFSVVTKQAL